MLDRPTKLPESYSRAKITYDGGSQREREDVLLAYHVFMLANDHLDYELLKTVWDANPDNLYFNTNQYTYEGLADWENIWDYYRSRFKFEKSYFPGRIHVVIRGEMACVEADGILRFKSWVGPAGEAPHNPPAYRATKVLVLKDGEWRVVHSHFSVEGEGIRPDKADKSAPAK
jgi:hypothetical protein